MTWIQQEHPDVIIGERVMIYNWSSQFDVLYAVVRRNHWTPPDTYQTQRLKESIKRREDLKVMTFGERAERMKITFGEDDDLQEISKTWADNHRYYGLRVPQETHRWNDMTKLATSTSHMGPTNFVVQHPLYMSQEVYGKWHNYLHSDRTC
ncbi:hypothetical protein BT63DRAFT_451099 [Microthyrium microscopicum]|uniref:Uncharacterized protein n=1 Tax=Microthyrium microscopicum TaxID=703497 RepID=A0A6A6ULF4_9PEZI|nr:hypothetical protein BT63DRAFT_451099 [Microthyrium microscopicum]